MTNAGCAVRRAAAACLLVPFIFGVRAQSGVKDTVSDAQLLQYATQEYDKREMMFKRVVLGINHGAEVVAKFPCGDICPNYTVRAIYYEVPPSRCSEVGGVQRELRIAQGPALHDESFCFPKVLSDNWDSYQR